MSTENLTLTTEIKVELIDQYGTDFDICRAAWVSSGVTLEKATEKRQSGLINALMRDRHGSPFEAGYFAFRVEAPRAVRDEHVRHRIGSYSSSSLRYTRSDPILYVPPPHRPLQKAEGFKQIHPVYEPYDYEKWSKYVKYLAKIYEGVYQGLIEMEADGFTETEALRWVMQDGLITPYIARFNPRSLMHFLALRTHDENANHVSYPMWEIEQVARQIEQHFAHYLPLTYAAFNAFGREAP